MAYLNLVGGQDELVFDGGSFVMSPEGKVVAQAKYLEEDLLVADLPLLGFEDRAWMPGAHSSYRRIPIPPPGKAKGPAVSARPPKPMAEEEEVYRALVEAVFAEATIPVYLDDGPSLAERPLGSRILQGRHRSGLERLGASGVRSSSFHLAPCVRRVPS